MLPMVPDGFFTKLLVVLRRHYSHMDFSASAAALYGRGLKAQLFLNPIEIEVRGADEGGGEGEERAKEKEMTKEKEKKDEQELGGRRRGGKKGEDDHDFTRSVVRLNIFTSTQKQMDQIQSYLQELQQFFPGMCAIDEMGTPSLGVKLVAMYRSTVKEPIQVQIISSTPLALGLKWEEIGSEKPATGTEIESVPLAQALQQTFEFTNEEFHKFEISKMSRDSYISAGGKYFKPAAGGMFFAPEKNETPLSKHLKQTILDIDMEGGQLTRGTTWQMDLDTTDQMRVVLVCVDCHISADVQPVQQFRAAVSAGLVIIPIICPGYDIHDYGCWWPANMPEMQKYALFVDLRTVSDWPQKVQKKSC